MVPVFIVLFTVMAPAVAAAETPQEVAVPGDAVGLSSVHVGPARSAPASSRSPLPRIPLPAAGAIGLAGTLRPVLASRRRHPASPDPLFVYIPGHGGSLDGFSDLAGRIGVDTDDVRVFDYRWAHPSADRIDASRWAPTDDAADALGAYLAAQGEHHRRIYVVGHSKGGAVIAELVARWDENPSLAPPAVTGAALLDPPIAAGFLGQLQSFGRLIGDVPDDGNYDPIKCSWLRCTDTRVDLGHNAGVEVIAIRNPDAEVTNFRDNPEGLRVFDLIDDGRSPAARWLPDIFGFLARVGEAHSSVLHHDAVAECIAAEAKLSGSCRWTGDGGSPPPKAVRTVSRMSIR